MINITAYNISNNTYFPVTMLNNNFPMYNTVILTLQTSQAIVNVTALQGGTNYTIAAFNVTNGNATNTTSNSLCLIPADMGINTIRVDVAGNTSMNYTVNITQALSNVVLMATGIYDSIINSSGSGLLVTSGYNCTSCNPPFGSMTSPYLTSDTTPTFRFQTTRNGTNTNANCRIGTTDVNYSTMGASRQCMGGDGLSWHICTLTSQDALPPESGTVYIACQNSADGTESARSSSGALPITGVASTPEAGIDYGVHQSKVWPGATVYTNQQVYLRDTTHTPLLTTVDRVVVYGNQRWLFNYDNTTTLGLFNISPVVYSLEMANMTIVQVEANVTAFINSTKN
jgi:hypothetical protein